jgi:hypothetical protein
VNETENALILARHRFDRLELETEGLPFAAYERNLSVLRLNRRSTADVSGTKLKIDCVQQRLAVQFMKLVARLESDPFRKRPGLNGQNS